MRKERHCRLSSLQRMTASPDSLWTHWELGLGSAQLPHGQFLSSHSWVCKGAGGGFLSLRSVSINKEVVTMNIHGRVLQTGTVVGFSENPTVVVGFSESQS